MSSYRAAVPISLLILLLSTAEIWYGIARECLAMLLVYSVHVFPVSWPATALSRDSAALLH